ncbi:hypothetical protein ACJX0J_034968, partial [Zea mays]
AMIWNLWLLMGLGIDDMFLIVRDKGGQLAQQNGNLGVGGPNRDEDRDRISSTFTTHYRVGKILREITHTFDKSIAPSFPISGASSTSAFSLGYILSTKYARM